jgi:hypothetical protein
LALANTAGAANYLILPWLLTILLVPAGLVRLEEWTRRSVLIPLALTLLGGLSLIHQRNLLMRKSPGDLDTYNVDTLTMLSGSPYLEIRSRQPQLLDPLFYRQLAAQNLWSFAPIIQRIDDEQYDLILVSGDDTKTDSDYWVKSIRGVSGWGPDTLGAMADHYRALCEIPDFLALIPRDRPVRVLDEDIARIYKQPCRASSRTPRMEPGAR